MTTQQYKNKFTTGGIFSKASLGKLFGYMTITAVLAMLLFFLIIPVAVIVKNAFYSNGSFTLEYFRLLFSNHLQQESILNSLYIGIATTLLTTLLCMPLCLINNKYDYKFKSILSGLLLVPMIMPPFVGAIGIQRFFARSGSLNLFLMDWGFMTKDTRIDWLGDNNLFWVVVILEVLHLYPIMYLNLSAALANIDPSMEEMASTLGVSKFQRLKDIVWPLSRPGFFAGSIIVFIWAMTDLGTPLLVGYHDTMPVQIFNMVQDANENPMGFALVFFVILLTVTLFLLSKFVFGKQNYEMMARGHVTSHVEKLSFKKALPVYALMLTTVAIAFIPHIAVFITSLSDQWFMTVLPEKYTLEHYGSILNTELPFLSIKNSIFFSAMSTLLDVTLGLMIAYVITRKLVPFGDLLDSIVMIPLALPGIVLAFGYVITYTGTFLDPFLNPVPLLVIAYAIRRLPYMVRSAMAGLQQTSKSLEEASATFGASKVYTIRKIIIPLVMANIIAGSLLCFAYAMLDVSDSLILALKEKYYPLTKAIYVLFQEQGRGELVASALGVVGMLILAGCIMSASVLLGKKMGELFRA